MRMGSLVGSRQDEDRADPTESKPAGAEHFFVASHHALFEASDAGACDACGARLDDPDHDGDLDLGFRVPGEGVYLWARGGDLRAERAPLCPECGSAIGLTAIARWEIEEEEG